MTLEVVCKDCGTVFPDNRSGMVMTTLGLGGAVGLAAYSYLPKGPFEAFSWTLLGAVAVGTLAAVGRIHSKCPACRSEACVPASTPLGQDLVARSRKDADEVDVGRTAGRAPWYARKLTKREIFSTVVLLPLALGALGYYGQYVSAPPVRAPAAAERIRVGSAVMRDGPFGQKILDIAVFNESSRPVKDIEIRCDLVSQTAAVVDHYTKVLYERVAAGDTLTATGLKMGPVSADARKAFCKVANAQFDG